MCVEPCLWASTYQVCERSNGGARVKCAHAELYSLAPTATVRSPSSFAAAYAAATRAASRSGAKPDASERMRPSCSGTSIENIALSSGPGISATKGQTVPSRVSNSAQSHPSASVSLIQIISTNSHPLCSFCWRIVPRYSKRVNNFSSLISIF